jgi:hypothetical protein
MAIRDLRLVDRINGVGAQSVNFLLMMASRIVQPVDHTSVLGVTIIHSRLTILRRRDRRIGIGAISAMDLAGRRIRRMELVRRVEHILMPAALTIRSLRAPVLECKTSGLGANTVRDFGTAETRTVDGVRTLLLVDMLMTEV